MQVVLSDSAEPGEGEHKVMEQMRLFSEPGTHAIYGLDADLVVLSLLTQDTLRRTGVNLSMTLFREEIENGVLTRGEDGEEVFQWFSIDALRALLSAGAAPGARTRDGRTAWDLAANKAATCEAVRALLPASARGGAAGGKLWLRAAGAAVVLLLCLFASIRQR